MSSRGRSGKEGTYSGVGVVVGGVETTGWGEGVGERVTSLGSCIIGGVSLPPWGVSGEQDVRNRIIDMLKLKLYLLGIIPGNLFGY